MNLSSKNRKYLTPCTVSPQVFEYLANYIRRYSYEDRLIILSFNDYSLSDFYSNNDRVYLPEGSPTHFIIPSIKFVRTNKFHILGSIFIYEDYFKNNPENFGSDISDCMKMYILALYNIGLSVIATVSPPDTFFERGLWYLTKISNVMQHKGPLLYKIGPIEEIVHIFEPTWVLERFCKWFLCYNFKFNLNNKEFEVSKSDITEVLRTYMQPMGQYQLTSSYNYSQIANKYFTEHISSTITTLIKEGSLGEKAMGTSIFVRLFSQITKCFIGDNDYDDETFLIANYKQWDMFISVMETIQIIQKQHISDEEKSVKLFTDFNNVASEARVSAEDALQHSRFRQDTFSSFAERKPEIQGKYSDPEKVIVDDPMGDVCELTSMNSNEVEPAKTEIFTNTPAKKNSLNYKSRTFENSSLKYPNKHKTTENTHILKKQTDLEGKNTNCSKTPKTIGKIKEHCDNIKKTVKFDSSIERRGSLKQYNSCDNNVKNFDINKDCHYLDFKEISNNEQRNCDDNGVRYGGKSKEVSKNKSVTKAFKKSRMDLKNHKKLLVKENINNGNQKGIPIKQDGRSKMNNEITYESNNKVKINKISANFERNELRTNKITMDVEPKIENEKLSDNIVDCNNKTYLSTTEIFIKGNDDERTDPVNFIDLYKSKSVDLNINNINADNKSNVNERVDICPDEVDLSKNKADVEKELLIENCPDEMELDKTTDNTGEMLYIREFITSQEIKNLEMYNGHNYNPIWRFWIDFHRKQLDRRKVDEDINGNSVYLDLTAALAHVSDGETVHLRATDAFLKNMGMIIDGFAMLEEANEEISSSNEIVIIKNPVRIEAHEEIEIGVQVQNDVNIIKDVKKKTNSYESDQIRSVPYKANTKRKEEVQVDSNIRPRIYGNVHEIGNNNDDQLHLNNAYCGSVEKSVVRINEDLEGSNNLKTNIKCKNKDKKRHNKKKAMISNNNIPVISDSKQSTSNISDSIISSDKSKANKTDHTDSIFQNEIIGFVKKNDDLAIETLRNETNIEQEKFQFLHASDSIHYHTDGNVANSNNKNVKAGKLERTNGPTTRVMNDNEQVSTVSNEIVQVEKWKNENVQAFNVEREAQQFETKNVRITNANVEPEYSNDAFVKDSNNHNEMPVHDTNSMWISNVQGIKLVFDRLQDHGIYNLSPTIFKTDHVVKFLEFVQMCGPNYNKYVNNSNCQPINIVRSLDSLRSYVGSVMLIPKDSDGTDSN